MFCALTCQPSCHLTFSTRITQFLLNLSSLRHFPTLPRLPVVVWIVTIASYSMVDNSRDTLSLNPQCCFSLSCPSIQPLPILSGSLFMPFYTFILNTTCLSFNDLKISVDGNYQDCSQVLSWLARDTIHYHQHTSSLPQFQILANSYATHQMGAWGFHHHKQLPQSNTMAVCYC